MNNMFREEKGGSQAILLYSVGQTDSVARVP